MENNDKEVEICTSMIDSLSQLLTNDYKTKPATIKKLGIIKDYETRLKVATRDKKGEK